MNMKHIDFAPRPRFDRWQLMLLALLLLGVLGASGIAVKRLQAVRELRAESGALFLSRGAPPASSASNFASPPAAQLLATNAAIDALNMPWPQILLALDQSKPASVAIVELESRSLEHSVRIVAEAQEIDALYDFVDAIGRQAAFRRVTPLSQDSIGASAAGKPRARMSLDVEWRR